MRLGRAGRRSSAGRPRLAEPDHLLAPLRQLVLSDRQEHLSASFGVLAQELDEAPSALRIEPLDRFVSVVRVDGDVLSTEAVLLVD